MPPLPPHHHKQAHTFWRCTLIEHRADASDVASDALRGTETAHPIHCTSQEEASQEALLTTLAAFSSNITSISAHHTTANTASGEL